MSSSMSARETGDTQDPAYWFLNQLVIVKATTESSSGAFSMTQITSFPGHETPYHLHHIEDEAFYVLEGQFTFIQDGRKKVLGPGDYIFLRRGIPHGIRCTGSGVCSMLVMAMPGTGFVGMISEMAEPAKERVLPTPTPPDVEKLRRLCAKYEIDILGPLPEVID